MIQRDYIKISLTMGLVFIAIGGWFLHMRIHPVSVDRVNYIPYISGLLSVFIIPFLFILKRTVHYAYLLNGMTVIIGTIMMTHYSISNFSGKITFSTLVLNTTLADILILWAKFVFGKSLFDLYRTNDLNAKYKGKFFRYPNMGFWWIHLFAMSVVYVLGNILIK